MGLGARVTARVTAKVTNRATARVSSLLVERVEALLERRLVVVGTLDQWLTGQVVFHGHLG